MTLLLYILATLPVILGAILWVRNPKIVWFEWAGSSALAFILAGLAHYVGIRSATHDYQTLSGQITRAVYYPEWVEQYEESHTRTTGSGKNARTETYYTTEYATHYQHWVAENSLGIEHEITPDFYAQICGKFASRKTEYCACSGSHSGNYWSGDHNCYPSYNTTGYLYPVNEWKAFENRIQASQTLFSFSKVPRNVQVFPYPKNRDWSASDRLIGVAAQQVDRLEFDRMNARLGPTKKVNVIFIGFSSADSRLGQWQQAAWIGGKKNDVVLTYGVDPGGSTVSWSFAFGWTEQPVVLRDLEALAIEKGVNTALLPEYEDAINRDYVLVHWHKFDYISIPVPGWMIWTYLVTLIFTQGGWWYWCLNNGYDK